MVSGQVARQVHPGSQAKISIRANASRCYTRAAGAKSSIRATASLCYTRAAGQRVLSRKRYTRASLPKKNSTRHVVLINKETRLPLVEQKDMAYCSARQCVPLFNKKTCVLFNTRRYVFLFEKKTCFRVQQKDMSPG